VITNCIVSKDIDATDVWCDV